MNDIRKKIDRNRDLFDDQEPSFGHMERFEALLKSKNEEGLKNEKRVKRVRFISAISVAASIAILIAVVVRFSTPDNTEGNISTPEVIGATDEFKTTNDYYNQKMEAKIADIMCKLAYTDTENQARLTKDIQRIIDGNNDFINEISKNEDKDMAIHFLVKHYRTNIHVLENIDQKLGKYTKC